MSGWLKPHIAVVTKVSAIPVHVEFFPSREDLLKEKSYLVKSVRKDGILILSHDDEDVINMSLGMPQKVITFGIRHSANISVSNENIVYEDNDGLRVPVGMSFKLNYDGNSVPVFLHGALGIQQIYPLLAGVAVGISQGIILTTIIESLSKYVPPLGRMNIIDGIHESIIIDDSYNSSPDALREALLVLGKVENTGKKIAIIGDMMELGKYSTDEHKKAGVLAKQIASVVVTVGQRMKVIGDGAISFNTSIEASDYVRGIVSKGDVVLVKGSQSVRMERVVKALLREPERASELLVRHEAEWLARK
jgi:UDP-N-acetylmuramoyl-tripeptide--D-alanyl-D-alanine ligase